MSLRNPTPESIQLLLTFLEDHQGKEIWFLLTNGFIKGTLDQVPRDPQEVFTLISATRYPAKGEKEELDQAPMTISQILGWGGEGSEFPDAKESDK
jgi:hypothetical protein